MLAQVTLTQAGGMLLAIGLGIVAVAIRVIGIPLAREWWQRRRDDQLSSDSDEPIGLEASDDSRTLRRATHESPVDLRPMLLTVLALHARETAGNGKRETGNGPGNDPSLHISDGGLTKGQWAQLEQWVRGGKKGLTQREIAAWMGKRDKTVGAAVRTIETRIAAQRQAAERTSAERHLETDYLPQTGVQVEQYIGPVEFLATQST